MPNHKIKFYPVDNGDTTLISLSNDQNILIDCKIREINTNTEGNNVFDVKKDLLVELSKRGDVSFLDLFILTHPDQDHCQGFEKHFYSGNPDDYSDKDNENGKIIIDEVWVTSCIFNGASNDDAKAFKKEAERRRKLWKNDSPDKYKAGNRIRMIGYDGDSKFEEVPNSVPGNIVNEINGTIVDNFEFFVHAPFKESLVKMNAQEDTNSTSIILQARFKINSSDTEWASFYLCGGDSDHYRWEQVLLKSQKNGNEDKLEWDLFLTPHHCSWTFFNDVPYKYNTDAKDSSKDILNYQRRNAKIIAASKLIKNNDDDPPHYQAKQEYQKTLETLHHFLETAKTPTEKDPKPIIFEIGNGGLVRKNNVSSKPEMATITALKKDTDKAPRPWISN